MGAGFRLHLRWLSDRIGTTRLRGMLLVLLSWTIAAVGAANWGYQYLVIQFAVGLLSASVVALGAPGLPALLGAVVATALLPATYNLLLAVNLGPDGSWSIASGIVAACVLAMAGVSAMITRHGRPLAPATTESAHDLTPIPASAAA
jgi:hypothetical protein